MNTIVKFSWRKNTIALVLTLVFSVVLVSGCGSSTPAPAAPAPAAKPAAVASPFRTEVPSEVGSKKITTVETDWSLDAINDKPHNNKAVTVTKGSKVSFGGWAVDRSHKVVPKTIYIKLTADIGGKEYYVKADRVKRPDVVKAFTINEYENAGFNVLADTKELAPGNYTVGILQIDDTQAIATMSKIQIVVQ